LHAGAVNASGMHPMELAGFPTGLLILHFQAEDNSPPEHLRIVHQTR